MRCFPLQTLAKHILSPWSLICLLMLFCLPPALAQQPPAPRPFDLQAAHPANAVPELWVRPNADRAATVQHISAEGALDFQAFNPHTTYELNPQNALWLHLRVAAAPGPPAPAWTLEFSKPFIDRIDFYYRDAQGQWASQASGSMVAHAQWPVRRLNPQFTLPALAPGVHDLYLRVQYEMPLRFELHLLPDPAAAEASQSQMLKGGLVLGLMVLMAALCGVLAVSYRDKVFACYGLYIVLGFLTMASYMGIASYAFWPHAERWAGLATVVLLMLMLAAQLQFCRVMFMPSNAWPWMQRLVNLALAFTLGVAALFAGPFTTTLVVLFGVAAVLCSVLILWVVGRALRQGARLALWWVLSYVPLHLVLMVTLVEDFGLASLPWLPYNAPVYAVVFEVLVLLAALHLYGKRLHAQKVRARTLKNSDAATGFWDAARFRSLLMQHWSVAARNDGDLALAYVQLRPGGADRAPGPWRMDEALRRSARLLHMVLRGQDTVARLGDRTLAIVMPGLSTGDALTERLSRLVALGLMEDMHDPRAPIIRFKIAVGSLRSAPGSLADLEQALQAQLASSSDEDSRPIHYVGLAEDMPSDSVLDALWERALVASAGAAPGNRVPS
jgi:two-component system, sensor histidine kinase LadS